MWSEIEKFFYQDPEDKSVTRQIVEIGVLYVILVLVVTYHGEMRLQWLLFSLLFLGVVIWNWGREFLRVALAAGIIVFGLVRPFVVQAFYIPSRSMENTLLVNDHIFVNKFIYMFTDPDRWDIVVFEYPQDPSKDYIKRLVGLPGDTVAVRNHQLYINGKPVSRRVAGREIEVQLQQQPKHETYIGSRRLLRFPGDGLHVNHQSVLSGEAEDPVRLLVGVARLVLEAGHHQIKEFVQDGVTRRTSYSHSFGPIHVPVEGETVDLHEISPLQKRYYFNLLRNRSDRRVVLQDNLLFQGDQAVRSMTVERDLYFMMGDNRDHSEDSRVWGFVPEDRIEGQAFLIYWPLSRIGIPGSR